MVIIILLFLQVESFPQSDGYIVNPVTFSSGLSNEFSPVFYKGGIVFCSDERDNSLASYMDDKNSLFKIFYVMKKGNSGWTQPKLLSREISTTFNDGPATFNGTCDTIYYSRNNSVENSLRNIYDTLNKLGIYSAEFIDGKWVNIRPFKYNDTRYNYSTPSLAPDGKRLYFSSDMPGGYGKMDLYYCQRRADGWDEPVNMGPSVNTRGNENFPFACNFDRLYFASDGLKGFGGKDLFYTQQINGEWINPVHLDSAINSPADDFGIVTDSTFDKGFFSSNRRKTDDIFSFSSPPVQFSGCDTMRENFYCFTLYDEKQQLIDTIRAIYKWDFGNGIIRTGKEVKHCFPGPGRYTVRLTITDELTGDTITNQAEYKVDLENIRQAYVKSLEECVVNRPVSFEGVISDLKGEEITDFYWDLGDGFRPGGPKISTTFTKKGDYIIRLGLLTQKDSLGVVSRICVIKKIVVHNNCHELPLWKGISEDIWDAVNEKGNGGIKLFRTRLYLMDDIPGQQRSRIERSFSSSGNPVLTFDNYGIRSGSYALLDEIAGILTGNPDLKLDLDIHYLKDGLMHKSALLPDIWAQELLVYLKGRDIDADRLHATGFSSFYKPVMPYVSENKMIDGLIDFVFTKK